MLKRKKKTRKGEEEVIKKKTMQFTNIDEKRKETNGTRKHQQKKTLKREINRKRLFDFCFHMVFFVQFYFLFMCTHTDLYVRCVRYFKCLNTLYRIL